MYGIPGVDFIIFVCLFSFFLIKKKVCVGGVEGPGKGTVCEALSRTTIILQELLRSLSGQIALQVSYLINIDMRGGIPYPKNSNKRAMCWDVGVASLSNFF